MLFQTTSAWAPTPSGVLPSGAVGTTPDVCNHRDGATVKTAWA